MPGEGTRPTLGIEKFCEVPLTALPNRKPPMAERVVRTRSLAGAAAGGLLMMEAAENTVSSSSLVSRVCMLRAGPVICTLLMVPHQHSSPHYHLGLGSFGASNTAHVTVEEIISQHLLFWNMTINLKIQSTPACLRKRLC